MKEILAKIVGKALELSPGEFASALASHRANEFAQTLRAIDRVSRGVGVFCKKFELLKEHDFVAVREENFASYELDFAANDERFALAA